MTKRINGGVLNDEAAEILANLSKQMPRSQVLELALKELWENKKGSVSVKLVQNAGFLNNSFNWFHNLKFIVAVRNFIAVHLPEIPDITAKLIWIFGGAAGTFYVVILLGLWPR